MEFRHAITRMLHDEHRATIEALDGLDDILARGRRGVPNLDDPAVRETLGSVAAMIEDEVRRHFAFEESELFTRLDEAGDSDIGEHLTDEHNAILPVGVRIAEMARNAVEHGMREDEWEEFRAGAAELIERMLSHIQKEEMALLPMLEDTLEPADDLALVEIYGSQH